MHIFVRNLKYRKEMEENLFNINDNAKACLKSTSTWQKICAAFFIFAAAVVFLMGIVYLVLPADMLGDKLTSGLIKGIGALFIVLGLVYILPCVYLIRSAKGFQATAETGDADSFENGLEYNRRMYKFYGILCFASILIGIAAVIIAAVATVAAI